ncbi:hypothetical protein GCM10027280_26460 [Micromonospora polyrhachis]|uniref:Uncharacterized protein n=1 Tax=Micromonospora polyrhachis TaxID=1282883 RepID=A0A7W7SN78_9ACTN|nr:hypothetical protein [Micromonospora polyrhachis]
MRNLDSLNAALAFLRELPVGAYVYSHPMFGGSVFDASSAAWGRASSRAACRRRRSSTACRFINTDGDRWADGVSVIFDYKGAREAARRVRVPRRLVSSVDTRADSGWRVTVAGEG